MCMMCLYTKINSLHYANVKFKLIILETLSIIYIVVMYCFWFLIKTEQAPTSLTEGLILSLRPANERQRNFVTTSFNGWAQA